MTKQLDAVRKSLCRVERGLYAFRYRSTPQGLPPVARLSVVSGPVSFATAPGRTCAVLAQRGQVLVLVAEAPSVIEVSLHGGDRAGADDTSFSLDLLDRGAAAAEDGEGGPASITSPEADDGLIGIEAHVARIGDVRAAPGSWIAGPDLPLPIEGLTLVEGRRAPGLEVQVRSAAGPDAWSAWTASGQFVGTRQRAEVLTGLRVRLRDAGLSRCTIVAEALFLGGAAVKREGAFVEFTSLDPLVGLKLDVKAGRSASSEVEKTTRGRVQVFKASR